MAARFYVNLPLGPGPVLLDGPEAHHLAVVCRLRPGDQVCLFNGDGREYAAQVTLVAKRSVELDVQQVAAPQRERSQALAVAAPLPKGDRGQFLVEKLTELGVTSFVPLRTQRSVVHPRESRLDRLERYVIEASKQCGRNLLMQVGELADWDSYCRRDGGAARRLVAHFGGDRIGTEGLTGGPTQIAIGPEGGFTDEEIDLARGQGWQVVGLGPRVLRVETAALVLAARISVE